METYEAQKSTDSRRTQQTLQLMTYIIKTKAVPVKILRRIKEEAVKTWKDESNTWKRQNWSKWGWEHNEKNHKKDENEGSQNTYSETRNY